MDAPRFDALTRHLARPPSRRAVLPLLGSMLASPLLGVGPTAAKKKKKKATLCLDGQTMQASTKKKKKLLKSGATPGACASSPPPPLQPPPPGCTPSCPGTACGGNDGCAGVCACAAGSLCYSGVCRPCDVGCTGNGTACGTALQTILTGANGGTVHVCPGRYVGSFAPGNGALIGAGEGENPATSTILAGNGNDRVIFVAAGVTAALHGLRITGGNSPFSGGGVYNEGTLTMTACTVDKNKVTYSGGGIVHQGVHLTLNACTVSRNEAGSVGGGIITTAGPMTVTGTVITGNKGQLGGGLYNQVATTFDSACSITNNTATGTGGGIHSTPDKVTLNGATVSGNSAPQCVNVTGC
jgi:predicted outer membrane repeat protein